MPAPSTPIAKSTRGGDDSPARRGARILVVDDDPIVAESLAEFLAAEGHEPATALDGQEALHTLEQAENAGTAVSTSRPFDVVITDVAMPKVDGMELLRRIAKNHPQTVVLMLTGYGTIESAVQAVRLGAADYLTKPVVDNELRFALERALRQQALLAENRSLKQQLNTRFNLDNIVGSDPRMLKIYDLVEAVAPTKTTVLMTGESGTGKSLIAHAIHHRSPRAGKPFVELACGSIPETLLESELFGHVKGAFTGAHADKTGKFLAASGGTIFLDEINSASPAMQLKLLRVLQERRFEPVGGNQTIEVDVRVILASNQPLERLVAAGAFRQDLYYRINVVKIELPPLRERGHDIPMLVEHFLRQHSAEIGKTISGFEPAAMEALRRYPFPGNVRELSNIVERAAVLARTPTITLADLPPHVTDAEAARALWTGAAVPANPALNFPASAAPSPVPTAESSAPSASSLDDAMKEPERQIILAALKAAGGNKLKAAQALKINRTTLYKKLAALGIDPRAV
jgi:DNA-binding NtrC family response regulator